MRTEIFQSQTFSWIGLLGMALTLVAVAAFAVVFYRVARVFFGTRGKRVVTCPENQQQVSVEVKATHAALTGLRGAPHLELASCTRWPEKAGCGQECLRQVEATSGGCLVRNVLADWYVGKQCVICAAPLGEAEWSVHKPALRSPEGQPVALDSVPVETIRQVLANHEPLCWNCLVAEKLRAEHPELVTERPWPRVGPCGERASDETDISASNRA